MSKIYVLIHDKGEVSYTKTFYEEDKALFKKLNSEGWGVYVAVNSFEATQEEMDKLGVKTKRNIPFLKKINYVFADLDVAKKGDGQSRKEKEDKKDLLLFDLYDVCPPTKIIDTSNGVQPLWQVKDVGVDEESQRRYVDVINAIIEWSKSHGAMGDKVKDVTRVLRCPGYYHMKEEPYMVNAKHSDDFVYTLKELEDRFLKFLPTEQKVEPKKEYKNVKLDDLSQAIDQLDIKEVAIRAFASIGRTCEFDKQGRAIIDGRLTGNFASKQGNFAASTSHEPFTGNVVTIVADIKTITNKEAREWLIDEFSLKSDVHKIKKSVEEKKPSRYSIDEDVKVFTWGTSTLDKMITPLLGGQLNLITGFTNMGKTTFAFDVAQKNAKMGHKVLYMSLEQSTQGIVDRLGRDYAGINKIMWRKRSDIDENRKMKFKMKVDEVNNLENLILYGFGADVEPTLENIFLVIKEIRPDLVFIDNFDDISKGDKNEYLEQNATIRNLKNFAQEVMIPINLTHHRNAKSKQKDGGSVRGSGKITDTSFTSLKCTREWDADASPKDNAAFIVQHEKDREFGQFGSATVYWQNGTFNDEYKEITPFYQDKI